MNLSEEERKEFLSLYRLLRTLTNECIPLTQVRQLKGILSGAAQAGVLQRNLFGMHPVLHDMRTAHIMIEEMRLCDSSLIGILLQETVLEGYISQEEVSRSFDEEAAVITKGLIKTAEFYTKNASVKSENFRELILSFAKDMRVILIMIADRVNLMRHIKHTDHEQARLQLAQEATYLYAPLAHKLGLYKLKSELEDLSLKYSEREVYYDIKDKLNETKASRDAYIASFIAPIQQKLEKEGLAFSIKGRTKSIHSIWNKIKKQKVDFKYIYDLFAIRIILDSPLEREKADCWLAYSLITDMYQPNPKRLRDWLSIPKSNGYESLHTTVMGPEGRWVEVQIRTTRMDDIAEHGLAAHWRYKGVKGENNVDDWLASVREAIENNNEDDSRRVMDRFKMDLYEDEVFVFTPKGDLFKLAKGSTVLDFAFHVHSKVGCRCIGARINGRNAQIRTVLQSGDQVEILTSTSQTPKQDWLNVVTTSKARNRIRQEIKEIESRQAEFSKEDIQRKFKNRKIEYDEAIMMRLIKKLGYKTVTEFYQRVAEGVLEVNDVVDKYMEQARREQEQTDYVPHRSAEGYTVTTPDTEATKKDDVLVIDQNLKNIDFTLSRCCNPIYGDEVFGFVTVSGGIKIHRNDCPNAPQLRQRFGYRIVRAQWAGKSQGKQYPITLRVIGHDDIGIVTNISSIINKEPDITLRSMNIDSHDGLFTGQLTIYISDTGKLEALLKKVRAVKGVKQVIR